MKSAHWCCVTEFDLFSLLCLSVFAGVPFMDMLHTSPPSRLVLSFLLQEAVSLLQTFLARLVCLSLSRSQSALIFLMLLTAQTPFGCRVKSSCVLANCMQVFALILFSKIARHSSLVSPSTTQPLRSYQISLLSVNFRTTCPPAIGYSIPYGCSTELWLGLLMIPYARCI